MNAPYATGQDVVGAVGVPHQPPGVHVGDGEQPELDRGDDSEVATATPQRPEQLGVVARVDPAQLAVGRDQLDRDELVGLQAEIAQESAHPAAK